MMWCSCTGRGRRGYKRLDRNLWGCEVCGKPTRAVVNKLVAMRAPKGSVALISVFSRSDGINEITFVKQDGQREMVLAMAGKPTVLERLWLELDTTMDSLMNVAGVPNADAGVVEKLRIRARAQAETLAILMSPFFNNADEIAREAKKRHDARKSGNEGYVTPGIAGEEYVPPSPPVRKEPVVAKKSGIRRTGKKLPVEALPTIKEALTSGMFTLTQIAKTYGVSEIEVKEQVGLD